MEKGDSEESDSGKGEKVKDHLIHGAVVGGLLLLAAVYSVKTMSILAEEKRLRISLAADVADRQRRTDEVRAEIEEVSKRIDALREQIYGPRDPAAAARARELFQIKP